MLAVVRTPPMRDIALIMLLPLVVVACGSDVVGTTTTADVTSTTVPPDPTTTLGSTTTTTPDVTTTAPVTTTTEADPYRFEIVISGTDVTGGGRIDVPLGETVTFVVTADVADELHVHGYDLYLDLRPGEPAEISFETSIPGTVEIELEAAGLEVVALTSS